MIFITGDCHSDFVRFNIENFDISGGILEPDDSNFRAKKKELDRRWLPYRINHVSWWAQELPSETEIKEGLNNLEANGNDVDFIVSHCCS